MGISIETAELVAASLGDVELIGISLGDEEIWPVGTPAKLTFLGEDGTWSKDPETLVNPFTATTTAGHVDYLGYYANGRGSGQHLYLFGGAGASDAGQKRYAYLGPWTHGMTVKNLGPDPLLIIEWVRGSENWRETIVTPGTSYTIDHTNRALNGGPGGVTTSPVDLNNTFLESNSVVDYTLEITGHVMQALPLVAATATGSYDGVSAVGGDTIADITIDGPSPGNYEIRLDGGAWVDVVGSTHQFTGLTNGQTYTVEARIKAQTFQGQPVAAGPIDSVSVIPVAPGTATPPPALPFDVEFWAEDPGFTIPNNGESLPAAVQNLGAEGGNFTTVGTPVWVSNIQNGRNAIEFVGPANAERLEHLRTLTPLAQRALVVVGKALGTSDADFMDTDTTEGGSGRSLFDVTGGFFRMFGGASTNVKTADTDVHLFIIEFSSTGDEYAHIDGVTYGPGSAGDHIAGALTYIGGTPQGAGNADGVQIAYAALLPRYTTAQERADLLAWFAANYSV